MTTTLVIASQSSPPSASRGTGLVTDDQDQPVRVHQVQADLLVAVPREFMREPVDTLLRRSR